MDFDPGTVRRWPHLTARVFTAPAYVEPAMFPSSAQTQVMLQLSGAMDLRVNTDGRERRYQTQPGNLSLTSAHLPDFEMAWQSRSSAPIRLLELCLDNAGGNWVSVDLAWAWMTLVDAFNDGGSCLPALWG